MRKGFAFLIILACVLFTQCEKDHTIPYGVSANYSTSAPVQTNFGGPFSFTGITIDPSPVKIGTASKLTAIVTGNNLSFVWTTSHGDLFGKGYSIYYSDSCIGEYSVTCTVTDGTNTKTITVPITVSN